MSRALLVLCLVACQSTTPPLPPAPAPHASADPLERARDYERGRGVAREYTAAAEIYRQRCQGGAGDLVACRRLVVAISEARGVDRVLGEVFQLAEAMCRRDDLLGCVIEMMTGRDPEIGAKVERLYAVPCDAQHRARCELERTMASGFNQSGTVQALDRAFDDRGCRLGVIEACVRLRYAEGAEHDAAVRVMTAACTQGDASACEAIDRPLSARERCTAHDFVACMALGCEGDAIAAAAALDHHAGDCPSRPETNVATRIATSSRLPLNSLEFRPIGTPVTAYQVFNAGTRPIAMANVEIYSYDAAGTPLAQQHVELRQLLEPGAGTLIVLRDTAASFEPCVSDVNLDDKWHSARCPRLKPPHVRWGDGHDNLPLSISFPDIPLASDDAVEAALAAPYELAHPGVLIRQVSDGELHLGSESTEPVWIDSWRTARGPHLELPLVIEPTAIVYQLDEVPDLQLSADTLAGVLSGQITQWNDGAIARDNPGRALPALAIKVFQPYAPNDELRVTRYLADRAPRAWKLGARRKAQLFPGAAWIDYRLLEPLRTTRGAISYVGAGLAAKHKLQVARVQGADKAFVAPTTHDVTTGAYPIASLRALYLPEGYPDADTANAVRAYATWLLDDGLASFEQLGYARPTDAVTRAARQQLARITVRARPAPDTQVVDGEVTLHLRVVGRGRAGARIVHRSYDSHVDLDKRTSRDGTLDIPHLRTAPQRYNLAVRGADGSAGWLSIAVTTPGRIDATVTLHELSDPGVLRIRVVDAQHQPIADAQVGTNGIDGVPTDAHGETVLDLHGHYDTSVQVWSSRGVTSPTLFELPQREPVTITVGP